MEWRAKQIRIEKTANHNADDTYDATPGTLVIRVPQITPFEVTPLNITFSLAQAVGYYFYQYNLDAKTKGGI